MSGPSIVLHQAHPEAIRMEPAFPCLSSRRLVGDPVDVITGANTDITVDFRLPGPLPLRWRRYYNSARNTVACSLGWGQTHDYDRTLTYDLDGLHYTDPLGNEVPFPPLEVGEQADNAGLLLRRITFEAYEVWQSGQPVQDFRFSGSGDTTPLRQLRQGQARIEFRHSANGRLQEIVDSLGCSIAVESNLEGRILSLIRTDESAPRSRRALMVYEYDQAGNPIVGRDLYSATLGFRWDLQNRMTCRTDRRGYSFHFAYDEEGRCVHSRGEDGLFEVSLDYQPLLKTTIVRRGDGGKWTYLYDGAGTVTKIVDPYGGVTSFTVDETGRVTEEIDPNGNITQLLYNSMGEPYARRDPLGYLLPTFEEDPHPPDPLAYKLPETPLEWEHGHLLRRREFRKPTVGNLLLQEFSQAVVDAFFGSSNGQHEKNATFELASGQALPRADEQGRPVEEGSPRQMQRWKYDPNGNLAEYQDRDGAVYRYARISWNALHQDIDPLGNITVFRHSSQGLVNSVQDPGGTLTEYGYDLKDRISEVRRHGRIRESYKYDAAGNIIEKSDHQGRALVTWKVGPANLDVSRRLSSGEVHSFESDERGRIIAAATPNATVTFAFDDEGRRLLDKRDAIGIAHEFDSGQLVATICFDRFRVSYRTEDDGDLVIADPTGSSHRIRVSERGLLTKRLANGARELCWYGSGGECRGKALMPNVQYRSPWVRTFTYSPAGDFLGAKDTLQGTVLYRYDKAHNLAEETLPDQSRRSFLFDSAGNLLHQPGLTGVAMDSGNRLQAANGDRFTYNGRDHLCKREGPGGATEYEYDALDMLVRCEISGESWTASYDALCRRIAKTWRGQTTEYYWDDFRLAAEKRQDGSLRIYIYVDHVALVPFLFIEYAGLDSESGSGKCFYIFTNQIGVPIRVEDDAGQPCWRAQIDPFGFANVSADSTLEMALRFPGHYYDPETGLHYNRFRYFSPQLGRYLQSDPSGQEGGINLYAYPASPLTGVDIDGLAKTGPAPKKPRAPGPKGAAAPSGAGAACPFVPGGNGPKPKGKDPAVKVGDVGKYKDLVARGRVGDKLTPDHIPSAAALIAAEEARRKKAGQKPLTLKEKEQVRQNGNCVVVPHDMHVAGETYGSKNKDKYPDDGKDKATMKAAEERDLNAHKDNAEDHGVDPATMDKAAKDLKKANKDDGVTA